MRIIALVLLTVKVFAVSDWALATNAGSASKCEISGETFNSCRACSNTVDEKQLAVIQPMLATLQHRQAHFDWHTIRNGLHLDASLNFQPQVQDWQERGLIPKDTAKLQEFTRLHSADGVLAGEDFFYMHRQMIEMVQRVLSASNQPCIAGWSAPPIAVNDPIWPVTSVQDPQAIPLAQGVLDKIHREDQQFHDSLFLRKTTLSEFGKLIENGPHLQIHALYSNVASHCKWQKPRSEAENLSVSCDDLVPAWSAPLNSHFWKLHGWVDDLLGAWLQANGYKKIREVCGKDPTCYEWRGTWNTMPSMK